MSYCEVELAYEIETVSNEKIVVISANVKCNRQLS